MKRDSEGNIVAFERGDVVWGIDPFRGNQDENGGVVPRPWLVISTESVPFHPDQYLCVTLTTRTWHDDSIRLSADSWVEGGAPEDSSIMPWSVSAIKHEFLDTTGEIVAELDSLPNDDAPNDGYQGRLGSEVVNESIRRLIGYLEDSLQT